MFEISGEWAIVGDMISVISGTNRMDSKSLHVARHVAEVYRGLGEEVSLLDLQDLPAEALVSTAYKDKPEVLVTGFTDKIMASDGLVVVVPEYNGSYPGILKYFVDLLPFPESFECRPVAFIGLAAGYYGSLRSVEQLQMVFAYRNAYLFNRRVFIPAVYKALDEAGNLIDEDLRQRLQAQAEKFLPFTRAVKGLT